MTDIVHIRPHVVRRWLIAATLIVLALNTVRIIAIYGFNLPVRLVVIDVSYEQNLPTWFSTLLLSMNAAILTVIAVWKMSRNARHRWSWAVLAAGFAVLSLDETASLHENLNLLINNTHVTKVRLVSAWVIAGVPFVCVIAASFFTFLRDLPARARLQFLVAGVLFVGGSVGMEVIWDIYMVTGSRDYVASQIIRMISEGMEMAGSAAFIVALLDYIQREMPVSIRVTDLTSPQLVAARVKPTSAAHAISTGTVASQRPSASTGTYGASLSLSEVGTFGRWPEPPSSRRKA